MTSCKGEEVADEANEMIYVAVGSEWKACKSSLEWVIDSLNGKRLCLVHVHEPSKYANLFGMKFPVSSLSEEEVIAHREKEKQDMCKLLDECVRSCTRARVQVEKLYIEKETTESGLVELISQHKIERFVMGAAADKKYSRKMTEPKSKKAIYVRQNAPAYCHILFTCKRHLIYTREAVKKAQLNDEDHNRQANAKSRLPQFTSEFSTSSSKSDFEESFDQSLMSSLSQVSSLYQFSESASYHSGTDDPERSFRSITPPPKPEGKQQQILSPNAQKSFEQEGNMDYALYTQFDQAIAEAGIAKHEAIKESMRRCKAEKDAIEAINKANAAESMYYKEWRRRKELEAELAKAKDRFESAKGT